MNQETYITRQFWRVLPTTMANNSQSEAFQIRMQIQSPLGKTNFINLSVDQFREIECLLAGWEN